MIISQEYNLEQELSSKIINVHRDSQGITQSTLKFQNNVSNSENIQSLMFAQHTTQFLITKQIQGQQVIQENQQSNKSTEELIGYRIDEEAVQNENFCKRIITKIKRLAQHQEFLQNSYNQYEEAEQRYIEKTKIIYSHFLLKDIQLTLHQIQHLKSILYVPNFGEAIVKWGNNKYGYFLNRIIALQRLSHMQQLLQKTPKTMQYKQQMKILIIVILLLVVIKLS